MLPVFASAQSGQKQLDSLHLAIKNAANDTVRMDVCIQLGNYYKYLSYDSLLYYQEQALSFSRNLKLRLNEASILFSIGFAYQQKLNFSKALEAYLKGINIVKDPESEKITWNLPNGQSPATERLRLLRWSYWRLGGLYGYIGHWTSITDKQIENYRKAIELAEAAHDSELVAWAYVNLGIPYLFSGKLDSAILLEQKAYSFFSNSPNIKGEGETLSLKYLGDMYQKKGNFDLARDVLLKAVQIDIRQNLPGALGYAYSSLGSLYMQEKKLDSAIYYAKKAVAFHKIVNASDGVREAYNLLYSTFDQLNNRDSAFAYLKLAKTLSDSLNDANRGNILESEDVAINEQMRLETLEKEKIETKNKIRTYTFLSAIAVFLLIAFLLYRNNRNRKRSNDLLQQQKEKIETQKDEVEKALAELKATQSQLIQSEKMASLGEVTAGIAHEIQNPLNFVNNFSEVSSELVDELKSEKAKGKSERDEELEEEILNDIKQNLEKINHHGQRASNIVKGMLLHSRGSSGQKEPTDINALCDEYLRLSYHGFRAKDKSFNADFKLEADENLPKINVVPQDIGRVLLNLINNAFFAVNEKVTQIGNSFNPKVVITTSMKNDKIKIIVSDNGNGIPDSIKEKIFQPFFTTKPTGSGTGLGLSLSYDIIKAHDGEISVESKPKDGTVFIINLPINQ